MRVLLDPQVFAWQKYGGISRLFAELYREFTTKDYGVELLVPKWYGENGYARDLGMPQRTFLTKRHFRGKYRLSRIANNISLRKMAAYSRPELVHPTYYDTEFRRTTASIPFVLTVFDMIHERFADIHFSHDRETIERKKELVRTASRIISISHSTKRDLCELLGTDENKIDVVHLASSLAPQSIPTEPNRKTPRPYILFVGQRSLYKNFSTFLKGVAPMMTRRDLDLWCVGGGGFTREEEYLANQLGVRGRISQLNMDESSLASAYRGATAFVFPSLYEGFGIPILEAFSQGCPVAVSDIAVFREVAGDAAVYFDPTEPESIREAVDKTVDDSEFRRQVVENGYKRGSTFSWERCARETAASYRLSVRSL